MPASNLNHPQRVCNQTRPWPSVAMLATLLLLNLLGGCRQDTGTTKPAPKPVKVGVISASVTPLMITSELPGRTEAWRTAEVRARVGGIVEQRLFTEGSLIRAGEPVFRLDQAGYEIAVDSAGASLEEAEASMRQATMTRDRNRSLLASRMISQQDLENSETAWQLASARRDSAATDLRAARLQLQYATVLAPIGGRIGRSLISEGTLIRPTSTTPMAVIQQLDPLYVNFSQPVNEVMAMQTASAAGGNTPASRRIRVRLQNGEFYPLAGELLFADTEVNSSTGQVSLRARIPNPDQQLLPGLYVQVELEQYPLDNAILIPQRAITRDGEHNSLWVVGDDHKVNKRQVQIAGQRDQYWIVSAGLQPGESVVIDGLQKLRANAEVVSIALDPQSLSPVSH